VFAPSKYVDDNSCDSLLCCKACTIKFVANTYSASYDPADNRKYLDMIKGFTRTRPGQRPESFLRPCVKNDAYIRGAKTGCKVNGKAPWWAPYKRSVLSGILWGIVLRYREILPRPRDRLR